MSMARRQRGGKIIVSSVARSLSDEAIQLASLTSWIASLALASEPANERNSGGTMTDGRHVRYPIAHHRGMQHRPQWYSARTIDMVGKP